MGEFVVNVRLNFQHSADPVELRGHMLIEKANRSGRDA